MALPLLPALRRAGIRIRLVFEPRHPAVRKVVRLSGWTAGYVAVNQVALWIVLVLANGTKGGVSIYQGAYIFFQLPHGLVAVSLMTTLSPELAETAARRDFTAFRRNLALGLRLMTLVILPASLGLAVLAKPVVSLLLERGALTAGQADVTAACVALFAVGLLPFSLYLYALRGFYALQDTRTPFVLNCWENARQRGGGGGAVPLARRGGAGPVLLGGLRRGGGDGAAVTRPADGRPRARPAVPPGPGPHHRGGTGHDAGRLAGGGGTPRPPAGHRGGGGRRGRGSRRLHRGAVGHAGPGSGRDHAATALPAARGNGSR